MFFTLPHFKEGQAGSSLDFLYLDSDSGSVFPCMLANDFHEGYDMSVYFQFLSAVSIFTVLLAVERSFASTGSQFLFPTPRALYTYVFPIRFLCGDLILPCWLLVHKVHTYMLNGWKNL